MVNKMALKKKSAIGVPTISLIITTVGLVVFAMLALQNSLNEMHLAEKSAEAARIGYELYAESEKVISDIDYICACSNTAFPMEEIGALPGVKRVTESADDKNVYEIEIYIESEAGDRGVETEIIYDRNEGRYDIKEQRLFHVGDDEADEFEF